MVPIIVLGDYSNDLIVDTNGTKYEDLSCAEKEDLKDDIQNRSFIGVSISCLRLHHFNFSLCRWRNQKA